MRVCRTVLLTIGILIVGASPAAADQAGPSSYESTITDVSSDLIDAQIIGGDAFLQITLRPGSEMIVPGYTLDDPEPYLRFLADGTVERNRNSPATYLNDDRFGQVVVPDSASPAATPDWEVVGSDGTYTWHDHRIHWMGLDPPASVRAANERILIQEWSVPMLVDGVGEVVVTGELAWLPDNAPIGAILAGVIAAAAVIGVWWARPRLLGVVTLIISALAAFAGWQVARIQPPEAGRFGPDLVLPLVAVALAVVAVGLATSGRKYWPTLIAAILSAAALGGWAVARLDATVRPVLPTDTPAVDRAATGLAGGAAIGAVLVLVAISVAPSLVRNQVTGTQSLPQDPVGPSAA